MKRLRERYGNLQAPLTIHDAPNKKDHLSVVPANSEDLILLRGLVGHNVLHVAPQDAAEVVDGGGVQGFVLPELVDGGAGDAVVLDEGIGGLVGPLQGLPKRRVDDQDSTSLPIR